MGSAIILLGHGSRDPAWRQPMDAVAAAMARRAPALTVRCAFLELCAPDLQTAASEVIALGAQHVRVVPLFLGAGRHVRDQLPGLVDGLRRAFAATRFELQPFMGEQEAVIELLATLALEQANLA